MIKQRIDQDLKSAMLAGDKRLVAVLRGLKSTILYAEVASGSRESELEDQKIISLLQKESRKRQDTADIYATAGEVQRKEAELNEKKVIDAYLPKELSEKEINELIDTVLEEMETLTKQSMGQVIGAVKIRAAGAAEGATIARLVQARL